MSTYRELIYMVLDQLKAISDDRYIEEEHIIFLLKKYRIFILENERKNTIHKLSPVNYQTTDFVLRETTAVSGLPCTGRIYLMSTTKLPIIALINGEDADTYFTVTKQDAVDETEITIPWLSENICYTNKKRFGYVGHNKFLINILYFTQGVDGYLYAASGKSDFLELVYDDDNLITFTITTIFKDPDALHLNDETDILDREFPFDDKFIPELIQYCLRDLLGMAYRPKDTNNNANDDLSTIATFIRQNMKSQFNKLLDGTEE